MYLNHCLVGWLLYDSTYIDIKSSVKFDNTVLLEMITVLNTNCKSYSLRLGRSFILLLFIIIHQVVE